MVGFTYKPIHKRTLPSDIFGHIPGVPVGSTFENRLYLHHASVHSGISAGINGSKEAGCYSVVMSGGYEDDKDAGDEFTYTGCGGRDKSDGEKPREGPQTCDQSWSNSRNASLKLSVQTQKPVRVVRGYKSNPAYAPAEGYRYDGLYIVDKAWMGVGKSGFNVCKFHLKRLPGQPPIIRQFDMHLSEWETPRHFGHDTVPSTSSRATPSVKMNNNVKRRDISTSTSSRAPRRVPVVLPPPAPIPPTTNAAPARSLRPVVTQAQAAVTAPPDMNQLLAEMYGSVWKPAAPSGITIKSTQSIPARDVSYMSQANLKQSTDSRRRIVPAAPASTVSGATRQPRASDTLEAHDVKRAKLAPISSENTDIDDVYSRRRIVDRGFEHQSDPDSDIEMFSD